MPEPLNLSALRCGACGALDPGPREVCAACGSPDLVACTVPGTGRLLSWTVIRRAPTRFKGQAPYTIAVVDLDAGIRLTGRLRDAPEGLRPGVPVAAVASADGITLFEARG